MEEKKEQAAVGLFVLVAGGLLLATVFWLTGVFRESGPEYHSYFKFAAGLSEGAIVRYAGGPQVGRVEKVHSDPKDAARMVINFRVKSDTPVKTDSLVKISSLSPLGDNYLEISSGSANAAKAPTGSELRSAEYTSFEDIVGELNTMAPQAQELLKNLNARVVELKETISRVNALIDEQNRANLSASLNHIRGMLEEDRPKIKTTLENVSVASKKIDPLMDDFKKTLAKAQDALAHVDETLTENRPDLRKSISELKDTLASAQKLTDQLNQTLYTNSDNLDEMLDNLRRVTENLKQFTETIKARPYTLIRSSSPPPHEPGQPPPKP